MIAEMQPVLPLYFPGAANSYLATTDDGTVSSLVGTRWNRGGNAQAVPVLVARASVRLRQETMLFMA